MPYFSSPFYFFFLSRTTIAMRVSWSCHFMCKVIIAAGSLFVGAFFMATIIPFYWYHIVVFIDSYDDVGCRIYRRISCGFLLFICIIVYKKSFTWSIENSKSYRNQEYVYKYRIVIYVAICQPTHHSLL